MTATTPSTRSSCPSRSPTGSASLRSRATATRSTWPGLEAGPPADNLVLRALAAARAAVGGGWPGGPGPAPALAARLEKRIPVAAGLAGGRPTPRRRWTARSRRGEPALDDDARHALARASRLGRAVLPRRRTRPRRGPRRTGRAPHRAPRDARRACSSRRSWPSRRPMSSPPSTPSGATATGRSGCRPPISPRSSAAKLSAADLVARAGVLASANDLLPATSLVVPGARAVQARAQPACSRRPIGLSGSGPTLWALYPSEAEAVEAAAVVRPPSPTGELTAPGSSEPFVVRHDHRRPQPAREANA